MLKQAAVIGLGALAGNMVAERFILKNGPDDSTGFIEVKEGFGMDDIVRVVVIVVGVMVASKFLRTAV